MVIVIDEKGYRTTSKQPKPILCDIDENGCLIPRDLMRDSYGYVIVTRYSKKIKLHRYTYMLHHNKLDLSRDVVIRHTCDNRECCNVDHLIEGTVQDNNQ